MINRTAPSSLYYLPRELIDQIVAFVSERVRDRDTTAQGMENLLALCRVESIGGGWMRAAEKQLCSKIPFSDLGAIDIIASYQDGDLRLDYTSEVIVYRELPDLDDFYVQKLYSILPRFKNLTKLELYLEFNNWAAIRPVLFHINKISTLSIEFYAEEAEDDEEEGETEEDWEPLLHIGDIPALKNLTKLSYCPPEISEQDLESFLGNLSRPELVKLTLNAYYSEVAPIIHLFPNLEDLGISCHHSFDLDFFSTSPPSLTKLSELGSPSLADQFRAITKNTPFYLKHMLIYCDDGFDYSFLPFVPASVQSINLNLEQGESEMCFAALKSFKRRDLLFKKLLVSKGWGEESFKSEIVDGMRAECLRIGVKVEIIED